MPVLCIAQRTPVVLLVVVETWSKPMDQDRGSFLNCDTFLIEIVIVAKS